MPKKDSYFQSKTDKIDITFEFWILKLVFVSNFTFNNFDFLDQICPKRYFRSKTEKVKIIIEFHIFKLVLVPNFRLNWQFWFFWPDLPRKTFFDLNQKRCTPHIFYITLYIQIRLVRDFSSNWQFDFLDQICLKGYFQSKTEEVKITVEFCILELV